MVYSALLKKSIGIVRQSLEGAGLASLEPHLRSHGKHEPAADSPLVLVACSGGRDSMALAALAHIVCPTLGIRCGMITIDHALQETSASVSAQVVNSCKQIGLNPVISNRVQVPHTRSGEEADARKARYQALVQAAQDYGASAVLLAHTADDQAEGVVIGLIRSSGLRAIAGMEEEIRQQGVLFLRPLLGLRREETTQVCQTLGIDWWDDPTNGEHIQQGQALSADFPLRSRVRHDLLPALNQFAGKDIITQLARTANLARQDQNYIDEQAQDLLTRSQQPHTGGPVCGTVSVCLRLKTLQDAHPVVRRHMWSILLESLGLGVSSRHIHQVDELVSAWHGQGPVALPSFYSATRQHHVILVCKNREYANR